MDWKEIGSQVATFAPGIGAAIGGPVGGVVGMGVKALCGLFGVDSASDDAQGQIEAALASMTPAQAVELKLADKAFVKEMKQLDIDVFKLEVEDRKSARSMFISTKSFVPAMITFIMLAVAGVVVYFVMTSDMKTVDKEIVFLVIGYVFSELKQATSFWLGSSKGSHDKNDILNKMK